MAEWTNAVNNHRFESCLSRQSKEKTMIKKTVTYKSESEKTYRIIKVYLFGILLYKELHQISEIEMAVI